MYPDFLKFLLRVIETLNTIEEVPDCEWYIGRIPVKYDGETVGYLVNEVGGSWSYQAGEEV